MNWINKDTELYCSFAKTAGNTGCQMMNSAFYYYELNKIYKSFSVTNIKDAVLAAKALDIKGFAVTMPYKSEILEYVDDVTEIVKMVGAANTVLNENGKLKAYNTDYLAAEDMLGKLVIEDFKCLYILGNGGYAKAVKKAAENLNLEFMCVNRGNWDIITSIKDSIIYNCTSVENINVDWSNYLIDCIVTTPTGKKLATSQASHQFKLYTGLEFPFLS